MHFLDLPIILIDPGFLHDVQYQGGVKVLAFVWIVNRYLHSNVLCERPVAFQSRFKLPEGGFLVLQGFGALDGAETSGLHEHPAAVGLGKWLA